MSDKIPSPQDVPALVALLSEQISDVKTSIDDLKTGLTDGLRHLEIRLDDHAMRLTNLERSEIRREESERVKTQMLVHWDQSGDNVRAEKHYRLSQMQVRTGWAGICIACATFIASEIHGMFS